MTYIFQAVKNAEEQNERERESGGGGEVLSNLHFRAEPSNHKYTEVSTFLTSLWYLISRALQNENKGIRALYTSIPLAPDL